MHMMDPHKNESDSASFEVPLRIPWHQNTDLRFLLFNLVFAIALFSPLRDLIVTTWNHGVYTYIPFIPFITAYLIFEDRERIFSQKRSASVAGYVAIGVGILLVFVSKRLEAAMGHNDHLAVLALSMIVIWIGVFIASYGVTAARAAGFPLLFLFFAVPIPDQMLDTTIVFLQTGSAELSYWFLKITGMPIARDGFVFHLPTMDVEVAKECSGIRSSLSLIITGTLAAGFFLRTWWARCLLMVCMVPIAIIKNAVRISSLSLLGVYVDERILASDLHRKGGFVFFILALVLAGGVIVLLRRAEGRGVPKKEETD
jgi:exosortase